LQGAKLKASIVHLGCHSLLHFILTDVHND
jgi:hypothetical protein